jgi:hypothetical protein
MKKKPSWGQGECKVPRKKREIRGKTKLGSGLIWTEKGRRKNANLGWHRDVTKV